MSETLVPCTDFAVGIGLQRLCTECLPPKSKFAGWKREFLNELLQQKEWLDRHTPGWQLRENIVLLQSSRQVETRGQRGKSRFCLVFERKEHAMLYRLTWQ
jgi:hypothetical protein